MSQYTTYYQQIFLCNGANRNEPNINWLSETLGSSYLYMVPAQFQQEITALNQNWNLIILSM